jgi:hypothetical protein
MSYQRTLGMLIAEYRGEHGTRRDAGAPVGTLASFVGV